MIEFILQSLYFLVSFALGALGGAILMDKGTIEKRLTQSIDAAAEAFLAVEKRLDCLSDWYGAQTDTAGKMIKRMEKYEKVNEEIGSLIETTKKTGLGSVGIALLTEDINKLHETIKKLENRITWLENKKSSEGES